MASRPKNEAVLDRLRRLQEGRAEREKQQRQQFTGGVAAQCDINAPPPGAFSNHVSRSNSANGGHPQRTMTPPSLRVVTAAPTPSTIDRVAVLRQHRHADPYSAPLPTTAVPQQFASSTPMRRGGGDEPTSHGFEVASPYSIYRREDMANAAIHQHHRLPNPNHEPRRRGFDDGASPPLSHHHHGAATHYHPTTAQAFNEPPSHMLGSSGPTAAPLRGPIAVESDRRGPQPTRMGRSGDVLLGNANVGSGSVKRGLTPAKKSLNGSTANAKNSPLTPPKPQWVNSSNSKSKAVPLHARSPMMMMMGANATAGARSPSGQGLNNTAHLRRGLSPNNNGVQRNPSPRVAMGGGPDRFAFRSSSATSSSRGSSVGSDRGRGVGSLRNSTPIRNVGGAVQRGSAPTRITAPSSQRGGGGGGGAAPRTHRQDGMDSHSMEAYEYDARVHGTLREGKRDEATLPDLGNSGTSRSIPGVKQVRSQSGSASVNGTVSRGGAGGGGALMPITSPQGQGTSSTSSSVTQRHLFTELQNVVVQLSQTAMGDQQRINMLMGKIKEYEALLADQEKMIDELEELNVKLVSERNSLRSFQPASAVSVGGVALPRDALLDDRDDTAVVGLDASLSAVSPGNQRTIIATMIQNIKHEKRQRLLVEEKSSKIIAEQQLAIHRLEQQLKDSTRGVKEAPLMTCSRVLVSGRSSESLHHDDDGKGLSASVRRSLVQTPTLKEAASLSTSNSPENTCTAPAAAATKPPLVVPQFPSISNSATSSNASAVDLHPIAISTQPQSTTHVMSAAARMNTNGGGDGAIKPAAGRGDEVRVGASASAAVVGSPTLQEVASQHSGSQIDAIADDAKRAFAAALEEAGIHATAPTSSSSTVPKALQKPLPELAQLSSNIYNQNHNDNQAEASGRNPLYSLASQPYIPRLTIVPQRPSPSPGFTLVVSSSHQREDSAATSRTHSVVAMSDVGDGPIVRHYQQQQQQQQQEGQGAASVSPNARSQSGGGGGGGGGGGMPHAVNAGVVQRTGSNYDATSRQQSIQLFARDEVPPELTCGGDNDRRSSSALENSARAVSQTLFTNSVRGAPSEVVEQNAAFASSNVGQQSRRSLVRDYIHGTNAVGRSADGVSQASLSLREDEERGSPEPHDLSVSGMHTARSMTSQCSTRSAFLRHTNASGASLAPDSPPRGTIGQVAAMDRILDDIKKRHNL